MKMEGQIRLVNIENIIPNRFQPRLQFDESALQELADSIKEHGIIQPLILRRVGEKFEIIAGERRYKASQIAGLTSVPSIICDLDDNESAEVAIIENTHRQALSPIEEAKTYKKLLDRRYVTQDQLAKRLGTSQSNIANKIRLLSLDENVQDALLKGKISERHARSLLRVTDKFRQVELLNKIIREKWPVRQLDMEIDKLLGSYDKNNNVTGNINPNSRVDINVDDIVNNSIDILMDEDYNNSTNYEYYSRSDEKKPKRDSLFFNNLENESANLNPTSSFGFTPFKNDVSTNLDKDYELLELDDEDDDISSNQTTSNSDQEVPTITVEKEYKTMDEVIAGIKDIVKNAKKNEVPVDIEEFSFKDYYQFIIRIYKENQDK